ncbi:DNA replication factor Cdt1-like [Belonocnema kinseyi]|uniref:DNA replication factor Cdt1-like n=1 Tax=Belonocnema kinseyi TaxID=2817044 RepID=UPI00143CE115|nr:DNA replication factor Cdt1-like [Belonocnema kinseyi]XP_033208107.1 DNA replication factor Cdt1-like [Belonocnema kinseyi]
MPRPRDKEKMSQPTITEYFSVRKAPTRSVDNTNGKEKLFESPKVDLDLDFILRKKKNIPQSTSSSRLLISVLEKNAKLKAQSKTVSRKENNNPNVKNASESENVLDSTKVEAMESSSSSSNEIVLPKEETLEENGESYSENCNISEAPAIKKIKLDEPGRQEEVIQKVISKNLQSDAVPVKKAPKTVKSVNNDICVNRSIPKVSLIEPKQSLIKTDESKTLAVVNESQSQTPKTCLPLPSDYKFLGQVFTCIDRVALMLHHRGEIITFRKLQPALKNMSKCEVTLDHLAQIKSIYPEAYTYENKKIMTFASGSRNPQNEMVLSPKFESANTAKESVSDVSGNNILLERSRKFYNSLLERVKDEHENFLKGCRQSRRVIPKEKIKRWHPRFEIEKCKPIEKSELPIIHSIKITSPKEVLEKVRECYKVDTNLKTSTGSPETLSVPAETKREDNAREYYCRLPSIAKILRNIFLSEKKNVLALNLTMQKLQFSFKEKLSFDETEKHLRLLCESVPTWINLFNLGKVDRLKFDKNISFEKVLKILEALAKKY